MKTVGQIADKFEKLLARLPEAIRKPVEREWKPVKELFIQQRPPRILVIGATQEAFLRSVASLAPRDSGTPPPQAILAATSGPWLTFRHRASLQFVIGEGLGEAARSAILSAPPDLFLLIADEDDKAERAANIKVLADLHHFDQERWNAAAPIIAVGGETDALTIALRSEEALRSSIDAVLPPEPRAIVLAAIAKALPQEAQLEFARVTGETAVQHEIASTITRSMVAVCAAIGAQPIPLADFPILTSLQVILVAGIIHVSGREWSLKTARDFLTALGANLGAALVFRESARAALKFLPGWGNAISGAIAGGGTYAIGRAATAYFIDELPLAETRRVFHLWKKKSAKPPRLQR